MRLSECSDPPPVAPEPETEELCLPSTEAQDWKGRDFSKEHKMFVSKIICNSGITILILSDTHNIQDFKVDSTDNDHHPLSTFKCICIKRVSKESLQINYYLEDLI